jgi:hypothetical protein
MKLPGQINQLQTRSHEAFENLLFRLVQRAPGAPGLPVPQMRKHSPVHGPRNEIEDFQAARVAASPME